jgi:hypothetical protein|tara:strand:- start:35 stop:448 length:414 start_codon:yes stop_codon:yes gene_type:complete
MGFLGKLAFWKKKDDFADLGLGDKPNSPGMDLGLGPETAPGANIDQGFGMQPSPGMPAQQQMQPPSSFNAPSFNAPNMGAPSPQPMQGQDYAMSKNIEVVSSKLDALRASLDSINQRLTNLESIARGEEDDRHRRRW